MIIYAIAELRSLSRWRGIRDERSAKLAGSTGKNVLLHFTCKT